MTPPLSSRYGLQSLKYFLDYLNSSHPNIRFTMEIESNGKLIFLDVLINRQPDGNLKHSVYRKPNKIQSILFL